MTMKSSLALLQAEGEDLGRAIRQRRKALGLTLQSLADATNLTASFISQMERGLAAPSITSLRNVAQALGLDPAALLHQPPAPDLKTRQGDRQVFGLANSKVNYERISSQFPGSVLRSLLIHEAPGHQMEPVTHDGDELFYVIAGTLIVNLDGERHVLSAGDSLHFASSRVHSTWNPSAEITTYLHTCTADVFGEGPVLTPQHEEHKTDNTLPKGEIK
jgi:transcriptional regulator with XRE-family HTH domain